MFYKVQRFSMCMKGAKIVLVKENDVISMLKVLSDDERGRLWYLETSGTNCQVGREV